MDDATDFGRQKVADFMSDDRIDRTIVVMDVPNIMGSAKRAAGGRDGARFSFDNIFAAISRFHTPRYSEREIVEAHAVTLMRDRPDLQRAVQAHLERAGFRVHQVVQKHPRKAQPVSFDAHVPAGKLSAVRSLLERMYLTIDASSNRRDSLGRIVVRASGTDYQGEQGVTDLALTNLTWSTLMGQFIMGNKINTVVLIAGDGDYKGLVHSLRRLNVRVEVYGPAGAISRALQKVAHNVVFMSHQTPENVSDDERFIFFKKADDDASVDDVVGYDFENAFEDADNPYLTSDTGEFYANSGG